MSLLLQALQKAAKNRDETTATNAVGDEGNGDLTLEPMAEPRPSSWRSSVKKHRLSNAPREAWARSP